MVARNVLLWNEFVYTSFFLLQMCSKHGTDFLEYKCRYCCSVAVFFCFGTTHFCNACHDDFQRMTSVPKEELPHCPAGTTLKCSNNKSPTTIFGLSETRVSFVSCWIRPLSHFKLLLKLLKPTTCWLQFLSSLTGPKGKQLEGSECPLHVVHPPTGEEFALGCGVCRNAHTF